MAVAIPGLVAAVSLARRRWFPSHDYAYIVRHIADVGGRHTPLVGVYSRFGWDHPGPLLFWILAPFERVGGPTGVLVGTAAINVACLTGALLVAYRRGGAAGTLWVGLLVAALCHTLGSAFLIDPWNPRLPVTGLVWFFLLAWSVSVGDTAMWPWLIGVGSWEVQTHIGFAPVVVLLLAFAVFCRLADRVKPAPKMATRATLGWRVALAVGVLLWAGPVIQQVRGHPGNLSAIVKYALHPTGSNIGLDTAVHIAGRQLSLPPPWITGHDTTFLAVLAPGHIWAGVAQLIVLAGLGLLAWRSGHTEPALLAGLSLVAVIAGVIGLAKIDGLPFPYLARWMWVVAMFVPLAAGWCIASLLAWPRWIQTAGPSLALAATVALAAVTTVTASAPDLPSQLFSDGLAALVRPTQQALQRDRSYLVVSSESQVVGPGLGVGLQAELEARGYHVFLPAELAFEAGSWRTTLRHRTNATLNAAEDILTPSRARIPT